MHEAFELDEPVDLGIQIDVTDVLTALRAREVYAAARAEPGRCAIIVAEGARLTFTDFDAAPRLRERLAAYERTTDPFGALPPSDSIDRTLAKLAELAGRDALEVLHRLDGETVFAVENEDDFELDDDMLLPEDPREAYAAVLAQREAARAERPAVTFGGMFGLVLDQSGPPRTYDVASAIAQLSPGESRVMRLATTPARALLYLGFGGWNDCPSPHEQARIWERWARTTSGEPAVLHEDSLDAIVTRPVETREALVQLAREVIAYDRDSVIEGVLPLLSMLYRNTSVRFWWD